MSSLYSWPASRPMGTSILSLLTLVTTLWFRIGPLRVITIVLEHRQSQAGGRLCLTATEHRRQALVGGGSGLALPVDIHTQSGSRRDVGAYEMLADTVDKSRSVSVTTATDEQLICALKCRDEDAFAEVFARFGAAVHGIACRVLQDTHLAEDVTQEVFVGLWRDPWQFDQRRGSIRSLLAVQSHGKSVDLVRSRNARSVREANCCDQPQLEVTYVDRDLLSRLASTQIKNALLRLPTPEREVIELAFFGSQTYKQVAVSLNLPEGTVKTRIRSGLVRLRSFVTQNDAW